MYSRPTEKMPKPNLDKDFKPPKKSILKMVKNRIKRLFGLGYPPIEKFNH